MLFAHNLYYNNIKHIFYYIYINMDEIVVFTDGSCSNNGKDNAKAGIGIYFSENDPRNISQRLLENKVIMLQN